MYELSALAEGADLDTAQSIIYALADVGSREAIGCLIEMLSDEELGTFAADALIQIGTSVIPQIRDVYEKSDDYGLTDHCRYILRSLHHSDRWPLSGPDRLLWRERDREFTDQLICVPNPPGAAGFCSFQSNLDHVAGNLVCISCRQASGLALAGKRRPLAGPGRSPKVTGSQSSPTGRARSTM